MLNVVLFCGGGGSSSLVKELSKRADSISTTLIINPFDDGKSTGRLRKSIEGLPGISDFRKNIVSGSALDDAGKLNVRVDDFAVGNGLIASLFVATGSFQAAINKAVDLFEVPIKILSITDDPAILSAKLDSGEVLESEADIVSYNEGGQVSSLDISNLSQINEDCLSEIYKADLIIFGAGTQHSSLLPSYLALSNFGLDISKVSAKKYLVANLVREGDTFGWCVHNLIASAARYWGIDSDKFIDEVILDKKSEFVCDKNEFDLVDCSDLYSSDKHSGAKLLDEILLRYNKIK